VDASPYNEGPELTVQDFAQILLTRWKAICGTIAVVVLAALAYLFVAAPQYQAGTRLYVASTEDSNATEANDGSLLAQRQVVSYVALLKGHLLAQRTIDKLNLDMTATQLQSQVTATAPADTVLIDVAVTDPSPVRARNIANTLSDEFATMAAELATPAGTMRPNTQVIVQQRADIPAHPVAPKRSRILLIAVTLGVVAGTILAIAVDRLDRTIKKADTAEEVAGVGVIGDIPFQAERRKRPAISFENDRSVIAEAFRTLRINLQFLEVAGDTRIVVVTSPAPGEGRTATAINLAFALAEADRTVALVDGDLRRPRVTGYLNIDATAGLSTVLTGQATLRDVLIRTRFPRVTVLASGAVPDNATVLLESRAAGDVLTELGETFDYVIVDSPPLLVTDAAIWATLAQGVLLIARFGSTKRQPLAHAAAILGRAGAQLLGTVITMTPAKKRSAAEQSYYGGPPQTMPSQGGRRWRGAHKSG
jgi:capsular exopolysaccharide synthesis family protein